jgi:hypothetical protein
VWVVLQEDPADHIGPARACPDTKPRTFAGLTFNDAHGALRYCAGMASRNPFTLQTPARHKSVTLGGGIPHINVRMVRKLSGLRVGED